MLRAFVFFQGPGLVTAHTWSFTDAHKSDSRTHMIHTNDTQTF